MDPLALLVAEHRVIESALDALDDLAAAAARGSVDLGRLASIVEFLRGYADAIHHGKEEKILFLAVERCRETAGLVQPLSALRRDHDTARLLTDDLAACAALREPVTAAGRARLQRTALDYTALLRRHIATEDGRVFPAIAAGLPAAAMAGVLSAFTRFEAEHEASRTELCGRASGFAAGRSVRQSSAGTPKACQ